MNEQRPAIKKETWEAFRKVKLLWFVNTILHLFGWVIVLDVADDGETVLGAYPARTVFRGFSQEHNDVGFKGLTAYLVKDMPFIQQLLEAGEAGVPSVDVTEDSAAVTITDSALPDVEIERGTSDD